MNKYRIERDDTSYGEWKGRNEKEAFQAMLRHWGHKGEPGKGVAPFNEWTFRVLEPEPS